MSARVCRSCIFRFVWISCFRARSCVRLRVRLHLALEQPFSAFSSRTRASTTAITQIRSLRGMCFRLRLLCNFNRAGARFPSLTIESINQPIDQSINRSMVQSIHQRANHLTSWPTGQSNNQWTDVGQPVCELANQPTNQPTNHQATNHLQSSKPV